MTVSARARSRAMRPCAFAAILLASACAGPTDPSPVMTISFADPVEARRVTCATCETPDTLIAEFPVALGDRAGPGGVLEQLEVRVFNRSRGVELGRNVRPNKDYAFPDTTVPAAGTLTVQAGIGYPPPLPQDGDIVVTVVARLTDGRRAERTARILEGPRAAS